MNTLHVLLLTLIMFIQSASGPTSTQKLPEEASIEGAVVTSVSGETLRRAQLTLTQVRPPSEVAEKPVSGDDEPPRFAAITPITTGPDGKFKFTKIVPGSYRLNVACNGYVSSEYGKKSSGGRGTIITLAPGQNMKDVLFRLQPAALITGHVRDSAGEPMTGVAVNLLKIGYDWMGNRTMMRAASSITDDRGEYRLYWVSPGRYYLNAATADFPMILNSRTVNMVQQNNVPSTYFPGTLDVAHATVVDVGPAGELGGMDITVTKPATFKITGSIVESSTGSAPKNADIGLVARSENEILVEGNFGAPVDRVSYVNGEFVVSGVIPGSYTLRASGYPEWNAPLDKSAVASVRTASDLYNIAFNRASGAEIPVDVSAADITGLKLILNPGVRLSLKVSLNGNDVSSVADFEKIRLSLLTKTIGLEDSLAQQGPLSGEGNGTIEKVASGRYRIRIEEGLPDLYIKEAVLDDMDALNGFVQINGASPAGSLRVVLGDKPGRIEGTLTDSASKPVAGIQVILIPESYRFRNELYKFSDTDDKGHYTFRGVSPGNYRIYAWESLEPYAYFDPELLAQYEQQGKFVHVSEASQENIDVRLIPAPKP